RAPRRDARGVRGIPASAPPGARVRLAAHVRGMRRRGRGLGRSVSGVPPLEHAPSRESAVSVSWATAALDLLYPSLCAVCDATLGVGRRDPLCALCWRAIERIEEPLCGTCGRPSPSFDRPAGGATLRCPPCATTPPPFDYARAAGAYGGPLRDALHALKFRGNRALARPLGDLVLERCGGLLGPHVDA